ncbi:MAG: DUF4450 domain-containing protein [Paludibacter sp.]|nr:DUF4450 domain-containing protein [Paludibacter sp.]
MITRYLFILVFLAFCASGISQPVQNNGAYWHNMEREVRYRPDGGDFVIENGARRFNRALYGGNTGFRVETGDIPEFAMFLPGMGGNIKIGIAKGKKSKWVSEAAKYVARYSPGKMTYEVTDPLLGKGKLTITVLALYEKEGVVIKVEGKNTPSNLDVFCSYGGVSNERFHRDGELGADPESSFYLKPENCTNNSLEINKNNFVLAYFTGNVVKESERYINPVSGAEKSNTNSNQALKGKVQYMCGIFPEKGITKVSDASKAKDPLSFFASTSEKTPALCTKVKADGTLYFIIAKGNESGFKYTNSPEIFARANKERLKDVDRVVIETPDPYLNNLGGVLSYAADATWESPAWLHGAIVFRMRLNGWRGPYVGDVLGWSDRSRTHFDAYAASQVISPEGGPNVPDPQKLLSRQEEKMGNAVFSNGYICRNPNENNRPHHYDMNLVYVDALLRHYLWTGDLEYVKKTWPLLKRHMEWEKRNFNVGRDGLYDAYAAIWASDGLQYNGGGVTHSSAYNYYSNKNMAHLAKLIGEDPTPYETEARNIKTAMDELLWYPTKGWYAEYRDYLGLKQTHPAAGVWTVYHTIDSEVTDLFKAYQMTEYINHEIPHIPVLAKGLKETDNYMVSTTNWMPYNWSVNNVVFAENLHTALSFWQTGRSEEAMKMFKGSILDAMYLGSSPGNFVQLSAYDAARGETYRDFADCIGMASRSLVEGLFGIKPNLLDGVVTIKPGFPEKWNHAAITIPDIKFSYKRVGNTANYTVIPTFAKPVKIHFCTSPLLDKIVSVKVNGKNIDFNYNENSIDHPEIEFTTEIGSKFDISIEYAGNAITKLSSNARYALGEKFSVGSPNALITDVFDPQAVLANIQKTESVVSGTVKGEMGHRSLFVKVKQNNMTWWEAVTFEISKPIEVIAPNEQPSNSLNFYLRNNTAAGMDVSLTVNPGSNAFTTKVKVEGNAKSASIIIPAQFLVNGYNVVSVDAGNNKTQTEWVANWTIENPKTTTYEKLDLTNVFNDKVTNIFKNKYLTPRCPYPTLALPSSGIGEWTHPEITANIDDSGLRKTAGTKNEIVTPQGVPFATPGEDNAKNIVFTSQWDNFPKEVSIPVNQTASHAYLLMAGSTNYMQSRFTNATVYAVYADGSKDSLVLRNPETWHPIEKDYYVDNSAFPFDAPRPQRLYLKTAQFTFNNNSVLPGFKFNTGQIDGGAATVLDLPLNASKQLKELVLKTTANEVVVGLMSVTLAK